MPSAKEIHKVAFFLYLCHWIFGLGVIQYPLGHPHPIISLIYSSICIIIYCSISIVAFPYMMSWSLVTAKSFIPLKLLFFSNVILIVVVTILTRNRSEVIFNSLRKIMTVSELMQRMDTNVNSMIIAKRVYVKKLITSSILVIIVITVNVTLILMERTPLWGKITAGISLCYPVVLMFIVDMTFVIRVCTISRKYQILNETLMNMLTDEPDAPRHRFIVNHLINRNRENQLPIDIIGYNVDNATTVIKLIKGIHLQLQQLCEEINEAYGLQILLSIFVAFGVITGYAHVSCLLLQDVYVNKTLALESIIYSSAWAVYYTVKVFHFTDACSRCKKNAAETGVLLNLFYDDPFANDEVKSEIRDFNLHLVQRPLSFTAAGFIALDSRLMKIMLSSITMYLVIFVELEDGLT